MSDVDFNQTHHVAHIHLNRPQRLNAITRDMAEKITQQILYWLTDDTVQEIVITAEGERAFSSGGDIASVYHAYHHKDFMWGPDFLRAEYKADHTIKDSSKKITTLMQGITMGGGVGVGCHAHQRIICDNTLIAMPECSIGLVPDVGGSYLLSRNRKDIALFLAMTGFRLDAASAVYAGFADKIVSHLDYYKVKENFLQGKSCDNFYVKAKKSFLEDCMEKEKMQPIMHAFLKPTLPEIIRCLQDINDDFAMQICQYLLHNSPLSLQLTQKLIDKVSHCTSMIEALRIEQRVTTRLCNHREFIEGVRAAVIDKDKTPKWHYQHDQVIDNDDLESFFEPLENSHIL